MATTVSLINMKGGVGKTTLAFNLAWYCKSKAKMKVLAVDLDPQANLSQCIMGAKKYLAYLEAGKGSIIEILKDPADLDLPKKVIYEVSKTTEISLSTLRQGMPPREMLLHLVPSKLELSRVLKDPSEKEQLLPQFLGTVGDKYDLIIIDCAPTESILTTAAYLSSSHIVVPVKPEFLATIGFPFLARSLRDFREIYPKQIDIAGIVFNDKKRKPSPEEKRKPSPEERTACEEVKKTASEYGWRVFENEVYRSDSFPGGSRASTPVFRTKRAHRTTKTGFHEFAGEFLKSVGLK